MMDRIPNPFAVQTPEDVDAQDVVTLFVQDYSDFHKIPKVGHTFLNGSRGSGKSMIFRFLEPDCQCIKMNKKVQELPFFGIYVPIKKTDLKLTELIRLENNHANIILNEHFMTVYIAIKVLSSLKKIPVPDKTGVYAAAVREFYSGTLAKLLRRAGWLGKQPTIKAKATMEDCFAVMLNILEDDIYTSVISYLRKVAFTDTAIAYSGPLFGYLDFLTPLMENFKKLPFIPKGPIFLLIDDADNLNNTQTMILNSWVSYRTSADISLKISTQMNYKTLRTTTGQRIDTPHDYSEVNISDIYTSQKNKYRDRIKKIVTARLTMYDIDVSPEKFFPPDEKQEQAIVSIAEDIRHKWKTSGRGHRPSDDVLRYARPSFIAELKGASKSGSTGSSKSGSTYSYAGFEQLVHISSGIVRFFLEPASLMFGEQLSRNQGKAVLVINPSIQNDIIREQSYKFLFSEFDSIVKDEIGLGNAMDKLDKLDKLKNIINALGGMFHQILISDAAERRVFSVAFTDNPDSEIKEVLDLGMQYGYFHRSTIGNKEGTGRTLLYILSRRLAPAFLLDPTSFAGYKFITNDTLRAAMHSPKTFLNSIKTKRIDEYLDDPQRSLFEEA
jgi:hypothetical protein